MSSVATVALHPPSSPRIVTSFAPRPAPMRLCRLRSGGQAAPGPHGGTSPALATISIPPTAVSTTNKQVQRKNVPATHAPKPSAPLMRASLSASYGTRSRCASAGAAMPARASSARVPFPAHCRRFARASCGALTRTPATLTLWQVGAEQCCLSQHRGQLGGRIQSCLSLCRPPSAHILCTGAQATPLIPPGSADAHGLHHSGGAAAASLCGGAACHASAAAATGQ